MNYINFRLLIHVYWILL